MKKKKTNVKTGKKTVVKKVKNSKPKDGVVKIANRSGLTPLGDRVVLKPIGADLPAQAGEGALTTSGIIIPETVDKERPEQAKVVAVGPGRYDDGVLIPMSVKVGDTVMFSKYGFDEVKYRGEEYYILKEDSILAIIS